ncbi:glycosyltransferase [Micromonospora sp. DT4]|uniref:glycosyltransferase n=1 Tax=Micromonospora sp. DT4 TaxID=3393438 RepID=UPI003CF34AEE
MGKVIIGAHPAYGHVVPVRAIAVDLVRRGHDVTFVTGTAYRDDIERYGLRFVPLSGAADVDSRTLHQRHPELRALPREEAFDRAMSHVFIETLAAQHHTIQTEIAKAGDGPVVVLHENMFMGMWPALLGAPVNRHVPVLSIGVLTITMTSVDTAPFRTGLPPDSSEQGRERNRERNRVFQERGIPHTQRGLEEVLRGLGVTRRPPFLLDGVVTLPDQYLQLCVEAIEYPRSDAPASLRFVGALPIGARDGHHHPLPEWWNDVIASDRPVIAVSQGTQANHDLSELIEPTLEALADLDVLVVATTGRDAVPTQVPANARVAPFVDFDLLLPHVDVFVQNGGYGGVQQSLAHGVPLVLAGQSEDKTEATARVAWTGAAINLATSRPDVAAIRRAVQTVLGGSHYRERAAELSIEYARHDALAEIAATVDQYLAISAAPVVRATPHSLSTDGV